MGHDEKRQLRISSDAGGSVSFERDGNAVSITQTVYYSNHAGADCPIVLDDADRRKLIDFLNMGEYRALSYEESR